MEQPKEQQPKKTNPFIVQLINSIGKKVTVVDNKEGTHKGILLSYSSPYLNLCIKINDKVRFIRNIIWFEVEK